MSIFTLFGQLEQVFCNGLVVSVMCLKLSYLLLFRLHPGIISMSKAKSIQIWLYWRSCFRPDLSASRTAFTSTISGSYQRSHSGEIAPTRKTAILALIEMSSVSLSTEYWLAASNSSLPELTQRSDTNIYTAENTIRKPKISLMEPWAGAVTQWWLELPPNQWLCASWSNQIVLCGMTSKKNCGCSLIVYKIPFLQYHESTGSWICLTRNVRVGTTRTRCNAPQCKNMSKSKITGKASWRL